MRRHPFFRAVFVLLAAAALLAACGDEPAPRTTDPGQPDQTLQADQEYDLDEIGRAAADLLGGDGAAAYAVLKASDSGYSPYQIAHAIDKGLIDELGSIESLTPAWPSGDTLSGRNDGMRFVMASVAAGGSLPVIFAETGDEPSSRNDFEQMFQEVNDEGQSGRWLVWLLATTGTGYSVGQITQYLGENKPFADLSPPTRLGVPFLVDGEGNIVTPVLPTDWAYKGRNILADLQKDEDLDFDDNVTVLVIGMVNAGYSSEQIQEAWRTKSIGLCSTQGSSSAADAAFAPCYVENGEIVSPAETTDFSPVGIAIEDVLPKWPPKSAASLTTASLDRISKLQSGEKVSLKLTPYIPKPDTTLKITAHDASMDLQLDDDNPYSYDITGSWRIELIQTETDHSAYGRDEEGETHVLEGEFWGSAGVPGSFRLDTESTWTMKSPTGTVEFVEREARERRFYADLDEDLEGGGFFGGPGPISVNWDTFPGVLE